MSQDAPPEPASAAPSFKLRFAAQREPGRSYVSGVKPRGLPATVTGKFYAREPAGDAEREGRALARLRDMVERGPRDRLPAPRTEAQVYVPGPGPWGRDRHLTVQEYGWWASRAAGGPRDPRLSHHVRDSAWLKARLKVLAADEKLKHK